jgi:hypothetical protein
MLYPEPSDIGTQMAGYKYLFLHIRELRVHILYGLIETDGGVRKAHVWGNTWAGGFPDL